VVGLVDGALVRKALDHAARLVALRFRVENRIFIQKTILNHMRVFDVKHCALEEDVIFAKILTRADIVGRILILVLLIVVLLVVVWLRSGVKTAVLVQVLWRS